MRQKNTVFNAIDTTYEHPLGERVKLLLKLETIFFQAVDHKLARDQYETRMCLDALFALLNVTNRYELRLVMLKELQRISSMLLQFQRAEDVNSGKVDATLKELERCKAILHGLDSKHIDRLRNIEFLNTIKLRNIHETGSFLFEIPEFKHWLLQSMEERSRQIQMWIDDFIPFKETTDFLLKFIRESSEPEQVVAKNGIYIKTVDDRHNTQQLLSIYVDEQYNTYPSISGDGYRFVVRFMEQKQFDINPNQIKKDVPFCLTVCGF